MNKVIHIAFAADERYFPGLLATMSSILINVNPIHKIIFYILDGGLNEKLKNYLSEVVNKFGDKYTVQWIKADLASFSNFPAFFYDSKLTYARLLFPEILQIDKVIYSDIDLIHLKDISELWKVDIDDKAAAVCQDNSIETIKNDCPRYIEEGLNPDAPYFNGGIMLLNLDFWRQYKISEQIIKYLKDYPEACKFWDQSAMNVILYKKFRLLDNSWNIQSKNFMSYGEFQKLNSFELNYHYTTSFKPWLYYGNNLPNILFYSLLEEIDFKLESPLFIKRKKIYKQKQKLMKILPVLYMIRSGIKRLLKRNFLSDLEVAEFWEEQIVIKKFQKMIKKEIDDLEIKWREKIRKSMKNGVTNNKPSLVN